MLMFGREIWHPEDLMFNFETLLQGMDQNQARYLYNLREQLETAHEVARSTLKVSQNIQKKYYDLKLNPTKFKIADIVFRVNHASKVGQSNKLKPPWEGPYVVTKILSPVLVRIKNRKRSFVIHHNNIKIVTPRDLPRWITKITNELLGTKKDLDLTLWDDDELGQDLNKLFRSRPTRQKSADLTDLPLLPEVYSSEETTRTGRKVKRPKHFNDYTA